MKTLVLLAVLALALPTAVLASSSIEQQTSAVPCRDPRADRAHGINPDRCQQQRGLITGLDLGSVSFERGALTSGWLENGGMFAGGGWFTNTGKGTNGLPAGTLFSGTFSGPVSWAMTTLGNGSHVYTLTGIWIETTAFAYPTLA